MEKRLEVLRQYKQMMERLDEEDERVQTLSKAKVNWDSSDSDFTVHCACGKEFWIIGEYSRFFKCACGRAYSLGRFVNVLELNDEEIEVVNQTAFWAEPII